MGLRSCLSLPLDGGDRSVGALTLYSRRAGTFGRGEVGRARRFVDEASRALGLTLVLADHIEITAQLRDALTARTVIDEATGIVMYQHQCDAEVALARLLSASRDRNVALDIVASEITTAASGKPPPDGFPLQTRPVS